MFGTIVQLGGVARGQECLDTTTQVVVDAKIIQREFSIHFRIGSAIIDVTFANNARQLSDIIDYIEQLQNDPQYEISHIHFQGFSSPDGSFQLNRSLAYLRSDALERFVCGRTYIPANRISRSKEYFPWDVVRTWAETSGIAKKQAVLDIIDADSVIVPYNKDYTIDQRVVNLQQLDGGRVWMLLQKHFPEMSQAIVRIYVSPKVKKSEVSSETGVLENQTAQAGSNLEISEQTQTNETSAAANSCDETGIADLSVDKDRGWRMLVKTDVAGWGLSMANLSMEIDFCPHLSLSVPVYYSFTNYFVDDLKFRTLAVRPELRYWLSPYNERFFVNAHFGMAHYNFAFRGTYRYQAQDGNRPALGGGIGIGYRIPLKRHWRLEFVAGAGAYRVHYDRFYNVSNGAYADTQHKVWIGPDQFVIGVGYSFGNKKGGAR